MSNITNASVLKMVSISISYDILTNFPKTYVLMHKRQKLSIKVNLSTNITKAFMILDKTSDTWMAKLMCSKLNLRVLWIQTITDVNKLQYKLPSILLSTVSMERKELERKFLKILKKSTQWNKLTKWYFIISRKKIYNILLFI